jgi:hypothetical protein
LFPSAQDVGQIKARVLHTIQYGLEFDLTTMHKYCIKDNIGRATESDFGWSISI